jgi:hypothetical protein
MKTSVLKILGNRMGLEETELLSRNMCEEVTQNATLK